jgi:hypothetical protein
MTQKKLRNNQAEKIEKLARDLMSAFDWADAPEGVFFWGEVHNRLRNRAEHGTTDGKPWVEPELTDEDAKQRPWVMVRDGYAGGWYGPARLAIVNGGLFHIIEMPSNLVTRWRFARLATPEEIEAANADR